MIPAEAVEAAAWTIYKAMHPDHAASGLSQVGGPIRAYCIDIARAALEAAAPQMLAGAKADAWDECAGGYLDQLVSITLNWEEIPNPYRTTK